MVVRLALTCSDDLVAEVDLAITLRLLDSVSDLVGLLRDRTIEMAPTQKRPAN